MPDRSVDFDLHGLIGVRLLNPTEPDVAALRRQLGIAPTKITRNPDIVVRFVSELHIPPDVRLLGTGEVGFCDQFFYVFHGKGKTKVRVIVPIDQFGSPCEFVCQSPISSLPLLIAAVNLRILALGLLPVHACAFVFRGKGILCTGWSKGGKTETLLGFMANGAQYVGDEWIYVDHQQMYGIPEPIHIWDTHLADQPNYRVRLGWPNRLRLRTTTMLAKGVRGMAHMPVGPLRKLLRRMVPVVEKQRHVKVAPAQLFGGTERFANCPAPLDHIVFVHSHRSASYDVRAMDARELAARMVHSLLEERADLVSMHEHFRFAFPHRGNRWLGELESLQRERLQTFFAHRPVHAVYHPYPVSPKRLYDVLHQVIA